MPWLRFSEMEILLLQDIPGVGRKNDLLVVGDGYALNHLLPRRIALVATPTVRKRYSDQIRRRAEEKAQEAAAARSVSQQLIGKNITITKKVTKTGKLYAAISEQAIADALKEQLKVAVDADKVEIAEPIKATGTFTVKVQLGEVMADLQVLVKAEA